MAGNDYVFPVVQNNSCSSILGIVCEKSKPLPKIPKNCHKPLLLDKQGAKAFGMCGLLDKKDPWLWLLDQKGTNWIPRRKLTDAEFDDYTKVRNGHSLSIVKMEVEETK